MVKLNDQLASVSCFAVLGMDDRGAGPFAEAQTDLPRPPQTCIRSNPEQILSVAVMSRTDNNPVRRWSAEESQVLLQKSAQASY